MENELSIKQDNKLTEARYELSLIEKRVIYLIIKDVRKKYVESSSGQKDLFDDLILTIPLSELKEDISDKKKDLKNGLRKLASRRLEIDKDNYWLEVGFINYSEWNSENGSVEIQVSKKIIPYIVSLPVGYTAYSLTVALALQSKWSQRLYELCCQWKNAGGFKKSVQELKDMFMLKETYSRYASFKLKVLEVARLELKTLYEKGECDIYFEYSEIKNGDKNKRSVTDLRFKIIVKEGEKRTALDNRLLVSTVLSKLYPGDDKTKNYKFRTNAMAKCDLEPPLMDLLYKKIMMCNEKEFPHDDFAKYIRFIINEEILKGL